MSRAARAFAALLAAGVLSACTALKFTYNHLDWIAQWQVGKFVELAPPQKALFDDHFRRFWGWHRKTQLMMYVEDLRGIAAVADKPIGAAQVEAYMERGTDHMARTMQGAVPDLARLLRALDDPQVKELLDNLAERREESREESQDLTTEELLERAEEQMVKNLKRWTGSLTREQRRRIRDWAHERKYAGTIWHQYQEAWAGAFADVLAKRRESDFEQHLRELFNGGRVPYGAEMEQVRLHNRKALIGLLADMSAMLTDDQRRHFRERVHELAADLAELAAKSQQATLPTSSARLCCIAA
jgi:hypothetical protein